MNIERTKAITDLEQEINNLKEELDLVLKVSKNPIFPTHAIVELVEHIRSLGTVSEQLPFTDKLGNS